MPPAPVSCSLCGTTWPMDPPRMVVCPHCRAGVGSPCHKPSGHAMFGIPYHPDRERLAMETVPGYDRCPAAPPPPAPQQASLFGASR